MITIGEKIFFNNIKKNCKIIFDVGARDDVYYVVEQPEAEIHLFEPNTAFYDSLVKNLKNINNKNLKINNFGLGNVSESKIYYNNTQSFTKLVTNYKSNIKDTSIFNIMSFNEYIKNNNIKEIDFIKIDTEGYEVEVIYSDIEFIKEHVNFLQFEYTSAWLSKEPIIKIETVYNDLKDYFIFNLLKDDNHPICKTYINDITILEPNMIKKIDDFMEKGYGFNFGLIKK